MGHEHQHTTNVEAGKRITIVFFLNVVFAIPSDAVHDTGDTIAVGFAWFLEKISLKKSNLAYTLGYCKFSLLGALITSVILLTGSGFVILEAILRLLHPTPVQTTGMFWLVIVVIIANGYGAYLMTRGQYVLF